VNVQCTSQCSGHGTCQPVNPNPMCACNAGYTGGYCEYRTSPLALAETVSGIADAGTWNYYKFVSNSTNRLVLSMTEQTSSGDCDLYVRAHDTAAPNRFVYDYKESGSMQTSTIEIEDANQRTFQIGIYGWNDVCRYQLSVSATTGCPRNCNANVNRGQCINGECACNAGFAGNECQFTVRPITIGQPANFSMRVPNDWVYYKVTTTSRTVIVTMKERPTADPNSSDNFSSDLELYVREAYVPDRTLFDYSAAGSSLFKMITISLDNRSKTDLTIDWYIGVFSTPAFAEPFSYDLLVWQPPF